MPTIVCSCGERFEVASAIPFRRGELRGDEGLRALAVDLPKATDDGDNALLLLPGKQAGLFACWTAAGREQGHVLGLAE